MLTVVMPSVILITAVATTFVSVQANFKGKE
jgi:hypothetical protein